MDKKIMKLNMTRSEVVHRNNRLGIVPKYCFSY